MIERYETTKMRLLWREELKFELWLKTELAVLWARTKRGELPVEQVERIAHDAKIDLVRITEIEGITHHDLLAFIEAVREHLEAQDRGELHRKMTSYDTEEIPTSIRIRDSIDVLVATLDELSAAILKAADAHRRTLMIGRTHGQHAEPITFGLKLLGWYDILSRDRNRLLAAQQVAAVGKLAGAVGVYGELTPEIEAEVCAAMGLTPARHATQILHRDRIAQVLSTLAILGGNIEHIVQEFRILGQTELCEVREPFGKGQKGSSRMPHKKNTIVTERLCGMSRLLRAYSGAALENIATWSERDITQSSVERVILPDSFHLAHYMLEKLLWVISGMEVFPDRMLRNLESTQGVIYSGRVKDLLLAWGMEPEKTYGLVQQCAFNTAETGETFHDLISRSLGFKVLCTTDKQRQQFEQCFDPWHDLQYLDAIFARFGL